MVKEDIVIGKEVYFVGFFKNLHYTILDVGEKYATMYASLSSPEDIDSHLIVDLNDFSAFFPACETFAGRVFNSEQEFKEFLKIKEEWFNFTNKLRLIGFPKDMTLEKIEQIKGLSGVFNSNKKEKLNKSWNDLIKKLTIIGLPKDMTLEKINQIKNLVGFL